VTPGPLHGPLTFRAFLMTCTVEVELDGLLAELAVEAAAEPAPAVELLPGSMLIPVEAP